MKREIPFTVCGHILTEHDIELVEGVYGVKFPTAYRSLMEVSNGGLPDPEVSYNFEGELLPIVIFFELSTQTDSGLGKSVSEIRSYSLKYFPFARDAFLQYLCFDFGTTSASIRALRIEPGADSEDVIVSDKVVAGSFDEFIDALAIEVAEEDLISKIAKNGTKHDVEEHQGYVELKDVQSKNELLLIEEAAKFGNCEVMRRLLKHGWNYRDALHLAVINNRLEAVTLLLENGADVLAPDRNGKDALFYSGGVKRSAVRALLQDARVKNEK